MNFNKGLSLQAQKEFATFPTFPWIFFYFRILRWSQMDDSQRLKTKVTLKIEFHSNSITIWKYTFVNL